MVFSKYPLSLQRSTSTTLTSSPNSTPTLQVFSLPSAAVLIHTYKSLLLDKSMIKHLQMEMLTLFKNKYSLIKSMHYIILHLLLIRLLLSSVSKTMSST